MKKLFYIAAVALLTVGMASCEKDDDNGGSNNTNNTNTPTDGAWVDLGLPSGLLWASCNIGSSSIEQYGNYYAWGETSPKSIYSWESYLYGDYDTDEGYTLFKYNVSSRYGQVDDKTVLDASDDAARAALGGDARMPTSSEWLELISYTTATWTSVGSVNGVRLTGENGNSIFLPAAGRKQDSELGALGESCVYWSSSLDQVNPSSAKCFYCYSDDPRTTVGGRNRGYPVRAVRPSSGK